MAKDLWKNFEELDKNVQAELDEKVKSALNDVEFQLNNVQGWIGCKRYDSAHIKAECLRDSAQRLVDALNLCVG